MLNHVLYQETRIRILYKLIGIALICLNLAHNCLADYLDPTGKTNVNQQTDLFQKSVGDMKLLEQQIEGSKGAALDAAKNTGDNLEFISGKTEAQVRSDAQGLEAIRENDLNDRGREELMKQGLIEEIYVDYTLPLNQQHYRDAERIANASDLLLKKLMDLLKDLGIDCKTVKGNRQVEPEYHLEISKQQINETIFNPQMCEELHNKYYCKDIVTLKCIKKGIRWGQWQRRTIRFNGGMLHGERQAWGYAVKQERKVWLWFITPYHPSPNWSNQVDSCWRNNPRHIIEDARGYIAGKLGLLIGQIGEMVEFPNGGHGIGNTSYGYGRWRHVWAEYEFGYYYRDATDICVEWSENWHENCKLQ